MHRTALVVAALLTLSGCCRLPRPETGPSSTEELLGEVRRRSADLTSLRGEVRVDHMGPGGRIAGKVYAFAASGGRLRLEVVSPMETPVRTVAVDGAGGTFTMTDQEEQRCVEAPAEPCLVGEAIGVELGAEHVASALAGGLPLIRHREARVRWNPCGYWELTLEGERDGWSEVVRLAPRGGAAVPVRAELRGPRGLVLVVEHEGHREVSGLVLPSRTRVRTPASGGDLLVDWRTVEVGVDLPAAAWRARCPDGFAVEARACTAAGDLPELEPVAGPEPAAPPEGGEGGEDPGGDLGEELGLD